jgi:hypothetical protein
MIGLMIIGLVVLAIGKLKLTRAIVLVGKKARWYGLTLLLTAIPFTLLVGGIIAAVTPAEILNHPLWRRAINYGVLISYMVLLALPFRERTDSNTVQVSQNTPNQASDATSEPAPGTGSSSHQG